MSEQNTPVGINRENVTRWFQDHTEITGPLEFGLIAGGRSNMTFTVTDAAGRKFVLRRPPMGPLLPSAHDVARSKANKTKNSTSTNTSRVSKPAPSAPPQSSASDSWVCCSRE